MNHENLTRAVPIERQWVGLVDNVDPDPVNNFFSLQETAEELKKLLQLKGPMSVIVVIREAVKFWTIDPAVGGWGRVVPNFYKSLFFMAYLAIFLPKISG